MGDIPKIRLGQSLMMGGDPEIFIKKGNKIVGSERIIPPKGLGEWEDIMGDKHPTIVRDGVQVELNIAPESCRELLSSNIGESFKTLRKVIDKNKGYSIVFDRMVKLTKKELDSLSPKSKTFGCMPSYNIYLPKKDNISKIYVNPIKYLYRGGGGHIHLGVDETYSSQSMSKTKDALKSYDKIIPMMDIIVGNFCVMIDREPLNVERRKNYGRAGEYRMPSYGVEYRVLSNFWLKNYSVMSLVYGLSRLAVYIVRESTPHADYYKDICNLVDRQDIIDAINNNDAILARKNWDKIKDYLTNIITYEENTNYYGTVHETFDSLGLYISKKTLPLFEHFIDKGLDYWFKGDSLKHWCSINSTKKSGWERFLLNKVLKDYNKTYNKNKIIIHG